MTEKKPDIVSAQEVADLADIQRNTVHSYRARQQMPAADWELHSGPIWLKSTILAWLKGRRRGR